MTNDGAGNQTGAPEQGVSETDRAHPSSTSLHLLLQSIKSATEQLLSCPKLNNIPPISSFHAHTRWQTHIDANYRPTLFFFFFAKLPHVSQRASPLRAVSGDGETLNYLAWQ